MNDLLISKFQSLVKQLRTSTEPNVNFKIKSFENAVSIIKSFRNQIYSVEQLKNIPGIGKGILERVEEILETGTLSELTEVVSEDLLKLQEEIGTKTAIELNKKGIKN